MHVRTKGDAVHGLFILHSTEEEIGWFCYCVYQGPILLSVQRTHRFESVYVRGEWVQNKGQFSQEAQVNAMYLRN